MRVTNGMLTDSFLNDLYKANKRFYHLGQQLSSNKRILRPSDDSIGTTRSIKIRRDISELEQFTSNVEDAKSYLTQVETSLSQMETMYIRLEEIAEGVKDGIMEQDDMQSYADEVKQWREELFNVANATYSDGYVFGGFNTTKAPFTLKDGDVEALMYNGKDIINDPGSLSSEENDVLTYKLANSVSFELGFNGVDLMGSGEDNVYNVLTNFINDLESGAIRDKDYLNKMKDGQNHMLALEAEIGAKMNRLDYMKDRYEDDSINFEERRSSIEDIDQAETISLMKQAETIYQATLHSNSMILQPTLLNYL